MFRKKGVTAWAAGLVLATGAFAAILPSAAASASVTFTSTSYYVTNLVTTSVPPGPSSTLVMTASIPMQQGESLRVTDQLSLTLTATESPEMNNQLTCTEPGGQVFQTSDGTNWANVGGPESWSVAVLMVAQMTGTATCQIFAQTSDGHGNGYQANVVSQDPSDLTTGTWLKISSSDEAGSQSWEYQKLYAPCDSSDSTNTCWYLGDIPGNPTSQDLFGNPYHQPQVFWTAANDATNVDVTGNFQMTSCPDGSSSCISYEHGSDEYTKLYTYLEFDQLNPDGSVCKANRDYGITPGQSGGTYVIYNAVHHQPFYYHVSAPVSQNCGGSRQFLLTLHIEWLEGNPIKLDDGIFSAINSVRATTATVPNVTGDTEAQADAAIAAAGLTVAPTYVMSPGPGTVLDQNSPSGTAEPTGSPVRITVSIGQVSVPYVLYEDLGSAEQAIRNSGLAVGNVSYNNNCVDPNAVQVQDPSSGVLEPLGTPVNVEVSTCSSGGGGGGGTGGGGSGSGNPIQPK